MKRLLSITLLIAAMLSMLTVGAQAADYDFVTDGTPEYYDSTSYEEVYGSQYNYGGPNVVDYQISAASAPPRPASWRRLFCPACRLLWLPAAEPAAMGSATAAGIQSPCLELKIPVH